MREVKIRLEDPQGELLFVPRQQYYLQYNPMHVYFVLLLIISIVSVAFVSLYSLYNNMVLHSPFISSQQLCDAERE